MLRTLVRLLAVGTAALPLLASAQNNSVTDTTNLDAPTHRSWPAGPGTQVDTGTGLLQTTIPFFSLKGPGRTSMSFGLYKRTNQANQPISQTQGWIGAGWEPSTMNYVVAGGAAPPAGNTFNTSPYQVIGGNAANHWNAQNVGTQGLPPSPIVRRPGIRADLAANGSGAKVTGWTVTEQSDSVRYIYGLQDKLDPTKWYLTSVVDPRGNTVTYTYNGDFHCTGITDAAGRTTTLAWDAGFGGLLRSVRVNACGYYRTWFLNYGTTPSGHQPWLKSVVYPPNQDGNQPTIQFAYSGVNDNLTDLYDARGANWHYDYFTAGWGVVVSKVYEPNVATPTSYDTANPTIFSYFPHVQNAGNPPGSADKGTVNGVTFVLPSQSFTCAIQDRLGKIWRHVYDYGVNASNQNTGVVNNDWMGNPIRLVAQPPVTGYLGDTNHVYYDTYAWDYNEGTLTQHVDGEGRQTDFTYDTSPRDNSGLVYSMTRYINNNPYKWTYTNWYLPGAQPRQVVTKDPDGRRTVTGYNWTYDEATYHDVDPRTDPYDSSYSKPSGVHVQTNFSYNAQGELTDTWTGSDAHTVRSGFDAYGNAQTATDPAGNSTAFTFDAWGNKKSQSGPAPLGETDFQYDNLDRLYEIDLPDGHSTGTHYDLNGNPDVATKEGGVQVTTVYDALNRPTSVSNPVGDGTTLTTSYGYNLRGERTSVTNPRGYVTHYGVDERGKLIVITYPGNGASYPATNTRQYGYDGSGNRMFVINGRGQKTTYAYDGMSRLTYVDHPNSADVSYQYRIDGVRTQMVDETGTTNYAYDDAGRLTSEASNFTNKTLTTKYVPGTNRRQSLSDGTQTWTYNYDAGLRLGSLSQTVGSATPVSYTYRPDEAVDVRTFGNGTSTKFGYDSRGRTTSILDRDPSGATEDTQGYAFGADGNLLSYDHSYPWGGWHTAYTHDGADRLSRETRTGGGGSTNFDNGYRYDPDGNRTSVVRNGVTYPYTAAWPNDQFDRGEGYVLAGYDQDGNPGAADDHGAPNNTYAYSLGYDEEGRLRSVSGRFSGSYVYDGDGRRVQRADSQGAYRFVYDGDQVVEVLDVANAVREYRTTGVGFVRGGAQRYELDSALGSALTVRDQSGNLTGLTEYDGYGREVYADINTDRGDFRFAGAKGYVDDDATGWQQLGAQLYIPQIGRFLTQDPIGQEGGINLYAYCENSPLGRVDPAGTETRDLTSGERARLSTAADFLSSNGAGLQGGFYKVLLQYAPETFQVDTEIGAAAWRYNTLYLGPNLFDETVIPAKAHGLSLGRLQATEYENKAWFSSILYHEFDHVAHDEETRIWNPFVVPSVERRAWGAQLGFLQRLQRGLPQGSQRSSRVDNLIDRAREGRRQYE